jgi:HEAT repeat protein
LRTGKELATLKGDANVIHAVAFTPDDKTLAAAEGPDTAIRLWDVSTLTLQAPAPAAGLPDEQLDSLWTDLAGTDAAKAYQAVWALTAAPHTVPWLKDRLRPVAPAEPRRVAQLIADLDSDDFDARQNAARELEGIGEPAGPALHKVLSGQHSPETRRRVEQLLERIEQPAAVPEYLRALRAVEVLEHIGTPEARQILDILGQGSPAARLTQEAKASLGRLGRPSIAKEANR